MNTMLRRLLVASAFLSLVVPAPGQSTSRDESLGQVAREQRTEKQQQYKDKKKEKRTYTDDDLSSDAAGAKAPASTGDETQPTETPNNSNRKHESKPQAENAKPVFDGADTDRADALVVPAGTEIRVDAVDGKVLIPVRVGFTTAIPALSPVAVRIHRDYYPAGQSGTVIYSSYTDFAELTSVTVGDSTYEVQTTRVPLGTPGSTAVTMEGSVGSSPRDVKFVLSAPLRIER